MNAFSVLASAALLLGAAPQQSYLADLNVCQMWHDGDVGQAGYKATINWSEGVKDLPPHLVLGALDTSGVVWVQTPRVAGRGPERLSFGVSDRSAYGLDFSVFGLTDQAYKDYRARCGAPRFACYFSENGPGVTRLSNPSLVDSPDEAAICDKRRS
jgi:hypothetical protein